MAKDDFNKSSVSNNSTNNTPSISDQQKVPPLRIVLNTSGNQKSSSTAIAVTANQQQDLKRDKSQDVKTDNVPKAGGRVRIKLGTNKQQVNKTNESSNRIFIEDAQKTRGTIAERQDNNNFKEEVSANYSHLRRITRRSYRTIQTITNQDEESISSMTSTDENQNTTNNNNSDNNSAQDNTTTVASIQLNATTAAAAATTTTTTATAASTNTNNSSFNVETPRRYKRRKGETSIECQLNEHDGSFNLQSYKLPAQNSFELYKNIRKQVDKKLKNLNSIHPKTPYGFRDYMLTRGAYLLDGNKLGNGTNLFLNEDGGLHQVPMVKYQCTLRHNRVNYSLPNRAKVPLSLAINSPLYNLFIDQEKERYKMRMQHIKEREKLTLAAEQEILRVYNQAAMATANQLEPFSVCTMLKHQEVYNYLDSDGVMIQAREDAQQDQEKQDGVQNRRQQDEQISPPSAGKNSNTEEFPTTEMIQKERTSELPNSTDETQQNNIDESKITNIELSNEKTTESDGSINMETELNLQQKDSGKGGNKENKRSISLQEDKDKTERDKIEKESENIKALEVVCVEKGEESVLELKQKSKNEIEDIVSEDRAANEFIIPADIKTESNMGMPEVKDGSRESENSKEDSGFKHVPIGKSQNCKPPTNASNIITEIITDSKKNNDKIIPMEHNASNSQVDTLSAEPVLSDNERRDYNKEIFLSQLQDIDDKWDKIRSEMFIRHRNEAESLYAVQRLEWEWKTKEIGACDVRTTPIIDNTLVPKLNIYSQDY